MFVDKADMPGILARCGVAWWAVGGRWGCRYAAKEERIGGVFPWFWNTGRYAKGCINGTDWAPCLNVPYGIGLESMPKCRAAFDDWGKLVKAHAPHGAIRPHKPAKVGVWLFGCLCYWIVCK